MLAIVHVRPHVAWSLSGIPPAWVGKRRPRWKNVTTGPSGLRKGFRSARGGAVAGALDSGAPQTRGSDDVGHPLGTVQGWSFKLGLTGKGSGRAAPRPRTEQAAA